MALVAYQDARPWARAIKTRVANREMPPWFADPKFSRELANNYSLTDSEIETIVAWVDAGAVQGAGTPPPPPPFTQGWHTFKNRPPDVILEMPIEFAVPASGALPVFTLWSPNPFKEDQFIEAVELRPGAIGAVHHSDVTARALPAGTALGRGPAWKNGPLVDFVPMYPDGRSYNELTGEGASAGAESAADARARRTALQNEAFRTSDDYRLLFYVPGGGFQEFPPGAVKRISAGNALAWNLHYTPTGRPEKDRHRLGLWLARTPPTHEVVTKRIGEAHIIDGKEFVADGDASEFPPIPPHADDWKITAMTPFQEDVTLYGLWPHMHHRGKDMTFIATFPDGREEVLLHVPKYDFYWQLQYQLATPVHLPAGSTIKAIGHYDNSTGNKYNPRPDAPVYWSEQSWDEMFNGWMELSVDRHVITRQAVYSLATPVNRRVSLGIGSGPPGMVHIRNADGSLVTSASIGASPSFIEPWTFARGQTVHTERAGTESGNVTVTLFDVPPDVTMHNDDRRPSRGYQDGAAGAERGPHLPWDRPPTCDGQRHGEHDEFRDHQVAELRAAGARVNHFLGRELRVACGDAALHGHPHRDRRSDRRVRRHAECRGHPPWRPLTIRYRSRYRSLVGQRCRPGCRG